MPKIQIFIWQIFYYAIPVRGVLFRRGLNIDPACPLCHNDIESMNHLFLDCVISSRVIECAVQQGWISNSILALTNNLCNRLQGIASLPSLCRDLPRIFFLLWHIWKARNGVVFRNESFQPMLCLVSAKKAFAEWRIRSLLSIDDYLKGAPSTPSPTKNKFVRWFPAQLEIVKINFDGSCLNSAAAGGFMLRDWTGKILKVGAANYGRASSLVVEARALKGPVLYRFM